MMATSMVVVRFDDGEDEGVCVQAMLLYSAQHSASQASFSCSTECGKITLSEDGMPMSERHFVAPPRR